MDYLIAHEQYVYLLVLCRFSDGLMSFSTLFRFAGLPCALNIMERAAYSKSRLQLALKVQVAPVLCHYLGISHKRHPSGCGTWSSERMDFFGCRRDWASFMVDSGSVVAILLTCIF